MLLLGWSAAQAQSDTTGLVRIDSNEVEVWVPDMANTNSKQEAKAKKRGQRYYTFDELIEKYGSREGFRSVIFGRKMMQMMADRVKSEDRELSDLLKGIYAIKAISSSQPCPEFVTDMKTWPETRIHVSLISQVEQNGQWTSCYLVDGGRWELSTFVLLSYGGKEETALLITGYFSVKDISRLASIRPK